MSKHHKEMTKLLEVLTARHHSEMTTFLKKCHAQNVKYEMGGKIDKTAEREVLKEDSITADKIKECTLTLNELKLQKPDFAPEGAMKCGSAMNICRSINRNQ